VISNLKSEISDTRKIKLA